MSKQVKAFGLQFRDFCAESGGTSEEEEGKEEEEGEGSSDASGASDLAEDLSLRDGQESSDTEPDDDVSFIKSLTHKSFSDVQNPRMKPVGS